LISSTDDIYGLHTVMFVGACKSRFFTDLGLNVYYKSDCGQSSSAAYRTQSGAKFAGR
jgi:hypothetical protein